MSDHQPQNDAWKMLMPPSADLGQRLALPQHAELLDDMHHKMSAWMKRRQEALETGMHAFQKMAACKDPMAMAGIYAEWMSGSLNRIMADLHDARDHALKLVEVGQKASQTMLAAQATDAARTVQHIARAEASGAEAVKQQTEQAPFRAAAE
jgi:hypothetical protein